jgi:hypothetical protein
MTVARDYTSRPSKGSTRHIRCTEEFVQLLEDDFGTPMFALNNAFMGFPREPKKSAIKLSAWAARQEDPAKALLAWTRKNPPGHIPRGTRRLRRALSPG